jgi:hypothetical protein
LSPVRFLNALSRGSIGVQCLHILWPRADGGMLRRCVQKERRDQLSKVVAPQVGRAVRARLPVPSPASIRVSVCASDLPPVRASSRTWVCLARASVLFTRPWRCDFAWVATSVRARSSGSSVPGSVRAGRFPCVSSHDFSIIKGVAVGREARLHRFDVFK